MLMKRVAQLIIPAFALLAVHASAQTAAVKVDSDAISGLGARNIGSATMSGRITSIAAQHEGQRLTIYVGSASGGVWKSLNGGTTFKPVFDKQPVQSIGAVTIDPKNPKTIWVGTGEPWTRNSVSIGDGVYKSIDGGDNWTNMVIASTRLPLSVRAATPPVVCSSSSSSSNPISRRCAASCARDFVVELLTKRMR